MGEEVEDLVKRLRNAAESPYAKAALLIRFNEPTGKPDWQPMGPSKTLSEELVLTADTIESLRASLARTEAEREEFALRWSNCAMRNAIALREIQLLAAAGLESGCVEGDDEYTLFTSIHRLSCEQQGTGLSRASDAEDSTQ